MEGVSVCSPSEPSQYCIIEGFTARCRRAAVVEQQTPSHSPPCRQAPSRSTAWLDNVLLARCHALLIVLLRSTLTAPNIAECTLAD